jgi:hypothetical protein
VGEVRLISHPSLIGPDGTNRASERIRTYLHNSTRAGLHGVPHDELDGAPPPRRHVDVNEVHHVRPEVGLSAARLEDDADGCGHSDERDDDARELEEKVEPGESIVGGSGEEEVDEEDEQEREDDAIDGKLGRVRVGKGTEERFRLSVQGFELQGKTGCQLTVWR